MENLKQNSYFAWYKETTPGQKKALLSASMGWMLDSMDIMIYTMILAHLMKDFELSKATGGLLNSLTLLASAVGGIIFGMIADRIGRVKALMGSILIYSVFTGACGFSQNVFQLAVFRVLLGLGMGGEWATGAALVSETWPAEHRGKAMGIMQSSWAVGYALAALVTALVLPHLGWRGVFFVGFFPALFILWIQHHVDEPDIWKKVSRDQLEKKEKPHISEIFRSPYLKRTIIVTTLNAGTMFGYWGLFTWIPPYLGLSSKEGGMGLNITQTSTWIIVMQVGTWLGYVSFGFICDKIGRKRTYIIFLFTAALLVLIYGSIRSNIVLLFFGPLLGFFGSGYFSGFGAITAEIFPTRIRASAQGFTYNIGRGLCAFAPFTVGALAQAHGLRIAFYFTSLFFFLSACIALFLPETKGKELE